MKQVGSLSVSARTQKSGHQWHELQLVLFKIQETERGREAYADDIGMLAMQLVPVHRPSPRLISLKAPRLVFSCRVGHDRFPQWLLPVQEASKGD